MRSKKVIALLLCAIMTAALFAGCSKKTDTQGNKPANDQDVIVTLGCWASSDAETKLLDDQIQAFQNAKPHITIKKQVITGDYLQGIQTKIASKTAPDIYYLDVSLAAKFINEKLVDPIDKYLDKADMEDFFPNLLEGYQKDGKTYGIPKDYNPLVLFYNKDMFDKAGIKPPTTWDELKEAAAKTTANGVIGLTLENDPQRFGAFILQNGGKINDGDKPAFNTPEAAEALDFYYSFAKNKTGATYKDMGVDWAGPALAQKKTAMIMAGGWVIPFMTQNAPDVKYGMVPLPKGKQYGNLLFTVAYVLNKDSKHKDQAMDVAKFLTGKDGLKLVADSGLAIPSRKSMANEYVSKFPDRKALIDATPGSTVANYGLNGSKILDVLGKAGEKIQLGKADSKTALKEAEDACK
ncbi:MAG TPA: ABC transporter substrate-binding protein [Clostridiaceae bacterium]|nr:ABC transporter substrate-binding protein [Clostridiaceae bacterium]